MTLHVWIALGSTISAIQPYVLQGGAGNWTWTGACYGAALVGNLQAFHRR